MKPNLEDLVSLVCLFMLPLLTLIHCSFLINMLPFSRLKFLNISSSSGILALQNGRNVQALRKTFSAGARAGPK